MENAFCGWLGRWYVCWLHSGSNCLLMHTVDGCIMCCNVMSVAHANRLPLLRLWSTADCDSDSFKQSCSIYLTFITPLAPLGHWDVMLVWRKGMLTELSLFYGIVCHYNGEVHNETGSSCRSVDQMHRVQTRLKCRNVLAVIGWQKSNIELRVVRVLLLRDFDLTWFNSLASEHLCVCGLRGAIQGESK